MRALIRDEEIIEEPFTKWVEDHLDWLTTPRPNGDGYELVEDYMPPQEDTPESYEEIVVEPDPVVEENDDEYVIIDGKKYSKAELRSLIE